MNLRYANRAESVTPCPKVDTLEIVRVTKKQPAFLTLIGGEPILLNPVILSKQSKSDLFVVSVF